jgi:hypothetical protein
MVTLPRTGLETVAVAIAREMGISDVVLQVTFRNQVACCAVALFTKLTAVNTGATVDEAGESIDTKKQIQWCRLHVRTMREMQKQPGFMLYR